MVHRTMPTATRRAVLAAAAGGALFAVPARADEVRVPAEPERQCATREFWRGQRRLSEDRRFVLASGRGTCTNPRSPAFQRQTAPTQGVGVWVRLRELG